MPAILSHVPTAFADGEVLVFTLDDVTAQTVCALCGVSGSPRPGIIPRLIVCDVEGDAAVSAKAACTADTPVLFLKSTDAAPSWTPSRFSVLSTPIRFSDFRNAVAQLCTATLPSDTARQAPHPQTDGIRVENGAAVSGDVRVPLTPCEEKILSALIEAYPHAASRVRLEEAFERHGSNSVRVYVTYLRKKLASLPAYRAILAEKDGSFSLVLHAGTQITDNSDKG